MSFATIEFFLFLAAVFFLYYLRSSKTWQNTVLVVASYVFYAAWDYRFCSLMLISSLIDFGAGGAILRSPHPRYRKMFLVLSLSANVLLLGFFKYFNFFVDSFALFLSALGWETSTLTLNIILPVGISFYTFQTMSYTIDIYLGHLQPCGAGILPAPDGGAGILPAQSIENNLPCINSPGAGRMPAPQGGLIQYLAFVSFFPQLVAGPIERATRLLPQFSAARVFSATAGSVGCRLILYGLFCKMVLADNLGQIVEPLYARPDLASPGQLAVATMAFGFQIYFDFAAYSMMAAGTARLFGIQLMRNFDYPYFSQSIREFWRRWHISLSTWFRDYVYVPLGGNRRSLEITYRNLFVTFLLSGLWHGAAAHFVLWGVLHGIYIILAYWAEAGPLNQFVNRARWNSPWMKPVRILRTYFLVTVAWVLFRAASIEEAFLIYQRLAVGLFAPEFIMQALGLIRTEWPVFLVLGFTVILEWIHRDCWNPLPVPSQSRWARWLVYTAVFWAILLFGTQRTADFIYFQF